VATYTILYWQEIPSQIKAEDDLDDITLPLDSRFMDRIDQLAAKLGHPRLEPCEVRLGMEHRDVAPELVLER